MISDITSPLSFGLVPLFLLVTIVQGNCSFPSSWKGYWFQSGVQIPVHISSDTISTKGICIESDGDKYLIEDGKDGCYRCVVMHEKHQNVLQYKETYCVERSSLEEMCRMITGDAQLHSMFRKNSQPIECPFKGPFTFTYSRGYRECNHPVSHIDDCTESSRLLLRYQACPDVLGSESSVEELQCLAKWKDGSMQYMVGKLHHKTAHTHEDQFRCFVYERQRRNEVGFLVAQSGDATCNGLVSATEGSKTLKLLKVNHHFNKCKFPSWITQHHSWHSLDGYKIYHFNHRNTILIRNETQSWRSSNKRIKETEAMKVVCVKEMYSLPNYGKFITHVTQNCTAGYMCMLFHQRDQYIIETRLGKLAPSADVACDDFFFDEAGVPFQTLIVASPKSQQCPSLGRWSGTGVIHRDTKEGHRCHKGVTSVIVGCSREGDVIEIKTNCRETDLVSSYSCHGFWEDNGTFYVVTSQKQKSNLEAEKYCFIYKESEDTLQLSSSTESCYRHIRPGHSGHLAINATTLGPCLLVMASSSYGPMLAPTLTTLLSMLMLCVKR